MKLLRRRVILGFVIDLVLLVVFVLVGRSSHGEALSLLGALVTLWPFLVGLILGWVVSRSWLAPFRLAWKGIVVWIVTVVVGMLLRVASGQGVALSFVVVATIVLGVFLLGWRAVALLVFRRRRSPV